MNSISIDELKQLFSEARTYNDWLPKEVSDQQLHELYELTKWGPTSANLAPARFVFVKSATEKDKLIQCSDPFNQHKIKAAPVTVIIAQDQKFYEQIDKLFPHAPTMKEVFATNRSLADSSAFRNSSLQGGYLILAARALGLDCGPMSGFDNAAVDKVFFSGTSSRSNFICNLGYGNKDTLHPRLARLDFAEACSII